MPPDSLGRGVSLQGFSTCPPPTAPTHPLVTRCCDCRSPLCVPGIKGQLGLSEHPQNESTGGIVSIGGPTQHGGRKGCRPVIRGVPKGGGGRGDTFQVPPTQSSCLSNYL